MPIKYSRGGTNPCQCITRTPEMDELATQEAGSPTWGFTRSCGDLTHREFAIGHDAKYKAQLIKAFREEVLVGIMQDGELVIRSAMSWALDRDWGHFMTPAPRKAKTTTTQPDDATPEPDVELDELSEDDLAPAVSEDLVDEARGEVVPDPIDATPQEPPVGVTSTHARSRSRRNKVA